MYRNFSIFAVFLFISGCNSENDKLLGHGIEGGSKSYIIEPCDRKYLYDEFSIPSEKELIEYSNIIENNIDKFPEGYGEVIVKKCALKMISPERDGCFYIFEKEPSPGGVARICIGKDPSKVNFFFEE